MLVLSILLVSAIYDSSTNVLYKGVGAYISFFIVLVSGVVNILKSDIFKVPVLVALPNVLMYEADVRAVYEYDCSSPIDVVDNLIKGVLVVLLIFQRICVQVSSRV